MFLKSPWYLDIVYVLQHLSPPPGMSRSKGRSLKLKSAKFCILKGALYWKDPGGVLLICLVEHEAQQVMNVFIEVVVAVIYFGKQQLTKC